MNAFSSQAGLASFTPPPAPVTIYAAVIEWPSGFIVEPSLILARSESERDAQITDEIRETADMLAEPDWRNALAAMSHTDNWRDWLEALDATPYGQPYVTTYEREV